MRYILLILILVCTGTSGAQQTARAYLTPEAMLTGNAIETEGITIKTNYREEQGEYSYWLSSRNRKINKRVQSEFWAIERNDSVFLNCNAVFHTHKFWPGVYAYVQYKVPGYLYFRSLRAYDPSESRGLKLFYGQSSPLFTVYSSPGNPERFNYLFDFDLGKAILLDRPTMKKYISRLSARKDAELINYLTTLLEQPSYQ